MREYYLQSENLSSARRNRFTKIKMQNGTPHAIPLHKTVRDQYRDEYTGELLPRAWVGEAIAEELE